jgi:hypothetical protein
MSTFESNANKYKTIRMERRNGILQMTLHTDGCAGGSGRTASCPRRSMTSAPTTTTAW